MKTSASIITKIALGALLAGSLAACNQNKPATPATPTAATSVKPEIVYINEDTVNAKYNASLDMRKRLEEKGKSIQRKARRFRLEQDSRSTNRDA